MTQIKGMHCLRGGHEIYHHGESSLMESSGLRTGLSTLHEIESVLTLVVSDEALEIAAGSNAEGVPTLAFGSYCFTCTKLFDEQ
jgi:hypothetical protein